ncbi:MAG: tetratricopeptide repeat protein [Pseudomonadota bacterium]|nr:tetratricopeptide repeat protein [Pseudomonadota bacterium]
MSAPESAETVANSGYSSPESEILFQLMAGELAGHGGDLHQAQEFYTRAAELSNDPEVAARATRIALYAGDRNGGVMKAANRWVELAPEDPEALQTLGLLYVRSGQPRQAIPYFERMLDAVDVEDGKGFMVIGASLAKESEGGASLEAMGLLASQHEDDPWAHFAYATLALNLEDYRLAVRESTRVLYLQPGFADALLIRAQAYLRLSNTSLAVRDMKSAAALNPKSVEIRLNLGRLLVAAEEYGEAREVFEDLASEAPGNEDLMYMLGLLNLQDQRYDDAERYFKRLKTSPKRAPEGHYYIGRVEEARGRTDEAITSYLRVEDGEYFLDAQVRATAIMAANGNLQRARTQLKRMRTQVGSPGDAIRLYLAEGQLLRDGGRYRNGMELYNRALTEHPANGDLLYARALMAEKLNRIDLLERDLQMILAEDPDNATALNALGFTLADRNERIPEALGYIERALEVSPDDPTVIDSMGWVQYRMGNYEEAEQFLRKAFDILPDPEIAGHLSETIWVQGNRVEARDMLKEALKSDPENDYLRELEKRFEN